MSTSSTPSATSIANDITRPSADQPTAGTTSAISAQTTDCNTKPARAQECVVDLPEEMQIVIKQLKAEFGNMDSTACDLQHLIANAITPMRQIQEALVRIVSQQHEQPVPSAPDDGGNSGRSGSSGDNENTASSMLQGTVNHALQKLHAHHEALFYVLDKPHLKNNDTQQQQPPKGSADTSKTINPQTISHGVACAELADGHENGQKDKDNNTQEHQGSQITSGEHNTAEEDGDDRIATAKPSEKKEDDSDTQQGNNSANVTDISNHEHPPHDNTDEQASVEFSSTKRSAGKKRKLNQDSDEDEKTSDASTTHRAKKRMTKK